MGRWLAVAMIATGLLTGALSASVASADPTYPAMNADGGIYWRSAPDWNAPVRVSGFGVYNGTTIAVHCYQSGTAVPGSTNTMWEQATRGRGPGLRQRLGQRALHQRRSVGQQALAGSAAV